MADVKKPNVYAKLIKARRLFIEKGVGKSGKNMALAFKYFELEDIVPTATAIFDDIGLIALVNFIDEPQGEAMVPVAVMNIVNCDAPDEVITFRSPMRFAETNKGVNSLQALGSSHTYMRRYLYMMALDICEADSIDADPKTAAEEPKKEKASTPPTAEQRAAAKAELTSGDAPADEMQIKAIKTALTKLRKLDSKNDEFVQTVVLKTEKFTNLTKGKAEELLGICKDMITQYSEEKK